MYIKKYNRTHTSSTYTKMGGVRWQTIEEKRLNMRLYR